MSHNRNNFSVGDVVKLKSGGPEMTVSAIAPAVDAGSGQNIGQTVSCVWFAGDWDNKMTDTFNSRTLESCDD